MKIVVLEGSPNKHGSSNLLADEFHLVRDEVLNIPVRLRFAGIKHKRTQCFLNGFVFFRHRIHAAVFFIIEGVNGKTAVANLFAQANFHAVHHVVRAAIGNDTLYVGHGAKLISCYVIIADLTVHA